MPRHNSLRLFFSLLLSNVSDALISAKTVLPWLFVSLGVPPFLIGFLVPIRESLALIPQTCIARRLRHIQARKNIWIAGALMQAGCIFAMLYVALNAQGLVAGVGIIVLLAALSLARAFCSLSIKELMGKCLLKSIRGRVSGLATSVSALLVIGIASYVLSDERAWQAKGLYWFIAAALCWLLAAGLILQLREPKVAQTAVLNNIGWLAQIKQETQLRRFIISRACLMMSGLLAPYLLLLAQTQALDLHLLAQFMLAASLAQVISPVFWGYFADFSSKQVMQLSAMIATSVALVCLLLQSVYINVMLPSWCFAVLFFILNMAHAGVRVGRAIYVVNMSDCAARRTDYVATSNSIIGVLLLISGLCATGLAMLGAVWAILFFFLLGMGALFSLAKLPEVER